MAECTAGHTLCEYTTLVAKPALGPERYVLSLALLVPLAIALVGLVQLPGQALLVRADAGPTVVSKRPIASNPTPPPTLVAPTPTPQPTAPPVIEAAVQPTATPQTKDRTYVVQRGDELKNIAAQYGVSIWKIIDGNDIPDPDSLRVGQVLKIPDN